VKLPLFVWAIFVTAILLLLALPVLAGEILFVPALNLANCWELLLKFITQSARNLLDLNLLGFFRDYTPELICCSNLVFIKNKSNFSYYLAGLIEGDGTIIVPKTERSIKGKINYPSLKICFHLKDLPLALLIQKNIGHGSITKQKGANAYIFSVNNFEGLIFIIQLINGKFRTPKIYALNDLIDWLNNKNSTLNLIKNSFDNSPLISNSWLSGFIESDGHFSVRTTLTSRYPKIECKFELSQRQNDHNDRNNLFFLETIAKFLLTVVKSTRMDQRFPQYRLRTTNLKGNIVLENYLTLYPLFCTKYLDYKDWLLVLSYFKSKQKKDNLIINKIISIKSNMNDKRTIFNWDHLQNFYNIN
jgi:hypothetical protein